MEIQKILFPQVGRCTDREMYFRLEKSGFGSNQMLFYDNERLFCFAQAKRSGLIHILTDFLSRNGKSTQSLIV